MIDLNYLHDLNLISARLYNLDLDLEQRRVELERLLGGGEGGGIALQAIESALAKIIVHDWPQPDDPVVRQLRAQALALAERMPGQCIRG
jgi:hypothetical protein